MEKFVKDKKQWNKPEKPCCLVLLVVGLMGAASLVALFSRTPYSSQLFCSAGAWGRRAAEKTTTTTTTTQLEVEAILHYATSTVVPQQSHGEITVTLDVLKSVAPCNFLVFGLGHDSLMWASLNSRGATFFLEEDPAWFKTVLKDAPWLVAESVPYRTQLSEADKLLQHYQTEPSCRAKNSFLRGNSKCRLALNMLSHKVYDAEWDAIMIDAPRGYFAEAPGRMAAIYSAAVMARNRKKSGVTHVFLHDVDRRVEKMYAEKFLCNKHLVKAVGRLWHFEIPPATNADSDFC
ncbi:phosphoacetylglucosamine mutase [Orobanche gracilis]